MYYIHVTDETWYDVRWPEMDDNAITVRWVRVNDTGPAVQYTQHIEQAPIVPQSLPHAHSAVLFLAMGLIGVAGALHRTRART